jgi:hypothetical protein
MERFYEESCQEEEAAEAPQSRASRVDEED